MVEDTNEGKFTYLRNPNQILDILKVGAKNPQVKEDLVKQRTLLSRSYYDQASKSIMVKDELPNRETELFIDLFATLNDQQKENRFYDVINKISAFYKKPENLSNLLFENPEQHQDEIEKGKNYSIAIIIKDLIITHKDGLDFYEFIKDKQNELNLGDSVITELKLYERKF